MRKSKSSTNSTFVTLTKFYFENFSRSGLGLRKPMITKVKCLSAATRLSRNMWPGEQYRTLVPYARAVAAGPKDSRDECTTPGFLMVIYFLQEYTLFVIIFGESKFEHLRLVSFSSHSFCNLPEARRVDKSTILSRRLA